VLSLAIRVPHRAADSLQEPDARVNAFLKVGQMELLVCSVNPIVRQAKAHHGCRQFEYVLKGAHGGVGST
jgi:hypothetical protein